MKENIRVLLLLVFLAALSAGELQATETAANGIYGGYLGSDLWFSAMRRSAANRAMLQSVAGTGNHRKLPADYVEFAGQIVFPAGNPFPNEQLPDLRIAAGDKSADPVERAPSVGKDGSFYAVFKKGVSYDVYWMYYFGSREKFASIDVQQEGPRQRKLSIEYRPPQPVDDAPSQGPASSRQSPGTDDYIRPQTGGGYQSPTTGPGFRSPTTGPGFRSPGTR